jgi:hypothetical protein
LRGVRRYPLLSLRGHCACSLDSHSASVLPPLASTKRDRAGERVPPERRAAIVYRPAERAGARTASRRSGEAALDSFGGETNVTNDTASDAAVVGQRSSAYVPQAIPAIDAATLVLLAAMLESAALAALRLRATP